MSVFVAPGAQGAAVAGMQGIGVKTPNAAAVADATDGLARLIQTPKGGMLEIGAKSMIVPAGILSAVTAALPVATNVDGAAPKEHIIVAPVTTWIGISPSVGRVRAPCCGAALLSLW